MNTITTYKFSELPTQYLKTKALNRYRVAWDVDHGWEDSTISDWKEKLEDLGFSDPVIEFSGFGSQGDGASFTSKHVPLPSIDPAVIEAWTMLTRAAVLIGTSVTEGIDFLAYGAVIRVSHSYVHENSVSLDRDWNDPPFLNETPPEGLEPFVKSLKDAVDNYFNALEGTIKRLCREIYADLSDEHTYLTSDEQVAEYLEANGMQFDVDEEGELVS